MATFIIQKILLDDQGLNHLCQTAERFFAVSTVLNNMVIAQIENKPSTRLLKHIIKCYNRLTENARAKLALSQNMPEIVKEKELVENLDDNSKKCLQNLCEILETNRLQENNLPSQPFDINNVRNSGRNLEYPSLGGVADIGGGVTGGIVGIGGLSGMPSTFSESMSIQNRSFAPNHELNDLQWQMRSTK